MKIKVIYEDNHIIVVEKPINIPVCPDESQDLSLLEMIKDYIKNKYDKKGNVFIGLIHRLDRPVGGVMVFARTSKAASRLSEQVKNNRFKKKYNSVVFGNPNNDGHLVDYLLKDQTTNISTVVTKDKVGAKESILDYRLLAKKDNLSLVEIELVTGRSHQIRVQFASRNWPLYGDQKYNKTAKSGEQLALIAKSISFIHPVSKEELTFEVSLPAGYPWTIFK